MRWRPIRPMMPGMVVVLAVASVAAGCSSDGAHPPPSSVRPSGPARTGAEAPPGVIATSAAGVTTNINVPAHSTEEEYFQACHAATLWMQGHPGDKQTLAERYLAAVQTPGVVGPGTWNIPWATLPLARQAGVIVAARAAADSQCG